MCSSPVEPTWRASASSDRQNETLSSMVDHISDRATFRTFGHEKSQVRGIFRNIRRHAVLWVPKMSSVVASR
jgi:hypothetical protein